jgi:HEAT repeat protein
LSLTETCEADGAHNSRAAAIIKRGVAYQPGRRFGFILVAELVMIRVAIFSMQGDFTMKRLVLLVLFSLFIATAAALPGTGMIQSDVAASSDLKQKIARLSSPDPLERASAACQIGEMGKQAAAAVPYLIQLLGDDTKISGVLDCGEKNNSRWRNNNFSQTSVGSMAAGALVAIGEPSVEPLIEALRTREPVARSNAVWALGIIKDPRTIEPVIAATKDGDPRVREHAAWGLGLKQDARVVEPLIAALADQHSQVREKAGWALGLTGDHRAVEPLINALQDAEPGVREQVAWSLGLKGDRRAVEPLVNALRSESPAVREKAAWALGLKGDKRAVEPLMAALKDDSSQVREHAAWALGLKGDHRALEALNGALKDESREVRKKAAWALGLLLMRDKEAADKASNLDLNLDDVDKEDGASAADTDHSSKPAVVDTGMPMPRPTPTPAPGMRAGSKKKVE